MTFTQPPHVLYENEHILVVNKPAGITVIPERNNPEQSTVLSLLEKTRGKLWVVHRLDKYTSGVMCFAKNAEAHRELSLQFQEHKVKKTYMAVVSGKLSSVSGTINAPIAESTTKPGTMLVHKRGKEAITHYKVEEQFKHAAVLSVDIETGRTHQIRVHMSYIGHPLLVDDIYANKTAFYFSSIKKGYKLSAEEERPTIDRLTLHALKLSILHPATNEIMSFEAPLPKDIHTLVKLLRKYDR